MHGFAARYPIDLADEMEQFCMKQKVARRFEPLELETYSGQKLRAKVWVPLHDRFPTEQAPPQSYVNDAIVMMGQMQYCPAYEWRVKENFRSMGLSTSKVTDWAYVDPSRE